MKIRALSPTALLLVLSGLATLLPPAASEELASAAQASEERVLRLVDDRTGEPVTEADVYVIDPRPGDMFLLSAIMRSGTSALDDRLGDARRVAPDADGRVALSTSGEGTLVFADAGGTHGFAVLGGAYDTGELVRMAVPTVLEIHTVDEQGELVSALYDSGGLGSHSFLGFEEFGDLGFTFRTGRNRIFEASTLMRALLAKRYPDGIVRLGSLGAKSPKQAVDLRTTERVVITVPPQSVTIQVVDVNGEPVVPREQVRIEVEEGRMDFGLDTKTELTLRGVPPGVEVRAQLVTWRDGVGTLEPSVGVTGAEGLELKLQSRRVSGGSVRGRLIDAEGAPLASRSVLAYIELHKGSSLTTMERELLTDAEGRVGLDPDMTSEARLKVLFRTTGHDPWLASEQVSRTVSGSNEVELGDVTLVEQPLILKGRVVDDKGDGLANVSVRVSNPQGVFRFVSMVGLREVRTDPDGRFAVYGQLDGQGWVVTAGSEPFGGPSSAAVPFEVGTEGVEVVLEPSGGLEVSLAEPAVLGLELWTAPLDPSVAANYRPRDAGNQRMISGDGQATLPFDGRNMLALDDMQPGRYDVRLQQFGNVLAEWKDVPVLSGERTRDPRMADIEFLKWLQTVRLEVVDAEGQLLDDVALAVEDETELFDVTGGSLRLAVLPFEAHVSVPGFRRAPVRIDGPEVLVELERAPVVTLRIPGLQESRGGGTFEAAFLDGHPNSQPNGPPRWFQVQGDVVELPIEQPGWGNLYLRERLPTFGGGTYAGFAVEVGSYMRLDMDRDGTQVEVKLDAQQRERLGLR